MTNTVSDLSLAPGPLNALTDVPGIAVGHYTHDSVARGVTAVLCPRGAAAGVSVRGSNPGTINTDALAATTIGSLVHGIGLTGGSLFGLSATTGMTEWLHERGHGLRTGSVLLPIMAGAVIYDLRFSDPRTIPSAEWGHRACAAATSEQFERGNVGVGAGATAGKGPGAVRIKGGLGTASLALPGGVILGALVVVNAMGGLIHPGTGELFAISGGFNDPLLYQPTDNSTSSDSTALSLTSTTLGVVATNADLDKPGLIKVADLAHNGLAQAIRPMHTMRDGDTIFTMAPFAGRVQLPRTTGAALIDMIAAAAADAMVLAVLDAAEQTTALDNWPSVAEAQATVRGN
jgi:L-aminopeptidase/D-esterase-like protein